MLGMQMTEFVGRKAELNYLQHRFDTGKPSVCAICGEANIGKTALVHKFCEDKRHLYISGAPVLPKDNLDMISRTMSDFSGTFIHLEDLEDMFERIILMCSMEHVVVVFDHLEALMDNFPEFMQFFHTFRTRRIENTRMMVIICDRTEVHIGRVFNKLTLKPLKFRDCLDFHPGYTPEQHVLSYFVAGGCPAYHSFMGDCPEESVFDQFFTGPSAMRSEMDRVLVPGSYPKGHYHKVLSIMASGMVIPHAMQQYVKQEGIGVNVSRVMVELEDRGIVKKVPSRDSKREMYIFNNSLFRFYYGVVTPVMADAGMMLDRVDRADYRKRLDDYMEVVFKEVCEEYTSATYSCEFIGKVRKDGDSADPDMDFVASVKENSISRMVVALCRLKGSPMGVQDLDKLVRRSKAVQGTGKLYCLFSGSGFTDELRNRVKGDSNVRLTTLDDVCRK